jgi:diguanylate cyclase (GGDEF)-like protein
VNLAGLVVVAACFIVIAALLIRQSPSQLDTGMQQAHEMIGKLTSRMSNVERQLNIDDLTGLANSRKLEQEDLPAAIRNAADLGPMLTVAYVDLDNMKAINDTQGHHVADARIKTAAHQLASTLQIRRSTDRAYRYYKGGDEFVVLMSGAGPVQGQANLEVILDALHSVGLAASIGAVVLPPGREVAPLGLLSHAEAAMRAVKAAGKNGIKMELLR